MLHGYVFQMSFKKVFFFVLMTVHYPVDQLSKRVFESIGFKPLHGSKFLTY